MHEHCISDGHINAVNMQSLEMSVALYNKWNPYERNFN